MADFWKRLKNTCASASEFLKDATVITGDVLKDAAVNTGEVLRDAGITTGKALQDAGEAVGCGAAEVARGAAETYDQWFGEDIGKILAECPVAKHILQHRETFEKDLDVFSRLYNVRTRPLITVAVLASGGLGAAAFDEALSRVTRHIFDGDQLVGGVLGDGISNLVGPEKAEAVNRFMDTVPGSDVMGGGWLHRIQHGHDIEALVQIGEEYGSEGVYKESTTFSGGISSRRPESGSSQLAVRRCMSSSSHISA